MQRHAETLVTLFTLLLLLLAAVACTEPAPAPGASADDKDLGRLVGSISYRERIALTNQAELVVTLEDVSRQDVASVILASQHIADPGQVPIRFELEYDRDAIDPRMRLVVRARITDRGRLLFVTAEAVPVLTRGGDREAHLLLVSTPK
jgi:putative lipoprotein